MAPGLRRTFDLQDVVATPWKNGGGLTQEITCWPPGAGLDDFQWRVSVASIRASGPFSVFPGIDRVILLLEGSGVRLRSPGQGIDHRLDEIYSPLRFSGDAACDCDLLGGDARDFNVMTRRASMTADVQVHTGTASAAGAHGLLLAAAGRWSLRTDRDRVLEQYSGIWWAGESITWTATPLAENATLIAVQVLHCA
jgi:environmental stress-induced protein Ves